MGRQQKIIIKFDISKYSYFYFKLLYFIASITYYILKSVWSVMTIEILNNIALCTFILKFHYSTLMWTSIWSLDLGV